MIGRAAQGNPWIFRQVSYYIKNNKTPPIPSLEEIETVMQVHLDGLYTHYGNKVGVRVARKHIAWYLKKFTNYAMFKDSLLRTDSTQEQLKRLSEFFKTSACEKMELAE